METDPDERAGHVHEDKCSDEDDGELAGVSGDATSGVNVRQHRAHHVLTMSTEVMPCHTHTQSDLSRPGLLSVVLREN